MTASSVEMRGSEVGPQVAELLGLTWVAEPLADTDLDTEVAGSVCFGDDVAIYIGGGLGESGGAWLTITYMHAARAPGERESPAACGTGAGTLLMDALRTWSEQHDMVLRFTAIENTAFFDRFDWLAVETRDDRWYYPARGEAAA